MRRYYPLTGTVISLFIALLGYVLRTARETPASSALTAIGSFALTFTSWLVIQWVIQRDRPRAPGWKCVVSIMGCMLLSLLLFYCNRDVTEIRERIGAVPRVMRALHFLLLLRGAVIGGFLFFIAYLLRVTALNQRSRLENEKLKKENLQARLSLLQEQVRPHFLFNSLGTLRSMVSEPAARDFIQRLADVYRYLLNNGQADLVDLRAELAFTQAYLYILQERFEDALVVDIDIPDRYLPMKLPPVTLQLLVENAVKHNVADVNHPLRLQIRAWSDDRLTVSNTLCPKRTLADSLGTGLNNIRDRYHLLLNRDIEVSRQPDSFNVTVYLLPARP